MKKLIVLATALATAAAFTACAAVPATSTTATTAATEAATEEDNQATTEELVGMANPWTESDREGVLEATGFEMDAPEGATDVVYSYMAEGGLAQMSYVLDGAD